MYVILAGASNSYTVHENMLKAQNNLMKTMMLVSLGFVVCWSCNSWYYFAYNIGAPLSFNDPFYKFSVIMVSVHCCINPFIYIINFDQFRSAVLRLCNRQLNANRIEHGIPVTNVQSNYNTSRPNQKQVIKLSAEEIDAGM